MQSWMKVKKVVQAWSPFAVQFKARSYPWVQLAGHEGELTHTHTHTYTCYVHAYTHKRTNTLYMHTIIRTLIRTRNTHTYTFTHTHTHMMCYAAVTSIWVNTFIVINKSDNRLIPFSLHVHVLGTAQ